jgi:hypothetical protein
MTKLIEVFFSYAHADITLRDELATHLSALVRGGFIQTWHDRQISAGTEWKSAIDDHLRNAHIILLLVSADFLASDYCYDIEMQYAMERHANRTARVLPILLRAVDWTAVPFRKLQALPTDGKPVTLWTDRDTAWLNVSLGIRRVVEELRSGCKTPPIDIAPTGKEPENKIPGEPQGPQGSPLPPEPVQNPMPPRPIPPLPPSSPVYTRLHALLVAGKWKEADQETMQVLLRLATEDSSTWLKARDFVTLSCDDLRELDRLWQGHSGHLFGLSVQRDIWRSLQGRTRRLERELTRAFGDQVGWRVHNKWLVHYDDLIFSSEAPKGHLPSWRFEGPDPLELWRESFIGIMKRVESCWQRATP